MSTYDISGLDWQTAHNNSTAAPSCRESDGMTKVADSFYEGQMEDPENLPTGHRGFKEEVMASMRAELESAEAYEPSDGE